MKNSKTRTQTIKRQRRQAKYVLDNWRRIVSTDNSRSRMAIKRALVFLGGIQMLSHSEIEPFILACVSNRNILLRAEAISTIEQRSKDTHNEEFVEALRQRLSVDTNSGIRASAAYVLGKIAGAYKVKDILQLLISIIENDDANDVRAFAYKAILDVAEVFSHVLPKQKSWQVRYDEPIQKQIDSKWFRKFKTSLGN
jgi:hypothetical protein